MAAEICKAIKNCDLREFHGTIKLTTAGKTFRSDITHILTGASGLVGSKSAVQRNRVIVE